MTTVPKYTLHQLFSQHPMLLLCLGLVAGILCASLLPVQFPMVGKAAVAGFAVIMWVMAVVAHRFCHKRAGGILFPAFLFAACAGIGGVRYLLFPQESINWPETPQNVKACVQTPSRETARTWSMDVRLHGGTWEGRRLRVRLVKQDSAAAPLPGDVLLLHGTISAPRNSGLPGSPDYAAMLRRQGIGGTMFCYADHWQRTGRQNLTLEVWARRLQTKLAGLYRDYFEGRDLAVLSALTLGDKTLLNADIREVFAETGTSHVLALSGLHLGILITLYNLLFLNFFRRYRRASVVFSVLGIVLLWLYVLLAGFPLSLCRAGVMYTIAQCFVAARRKGFSLNNLASSACILLLCDPLALFDIGFQLSFLSVGGIVLFLPLFPRIPFFGRDRWRTWAHRLLSSVYGIFSVSVCATVATLPLVAFTFHRVPVYGLLASFVAIPLAYPVLFFSLAFLLLPFARSVTAAVLAALLHGMFGALEWVSSLPAASFTWYPTATGVLLMYAALLALYSFLARRSVWKLSAILLLACATVATEVSHRRTHRLRPQLVFYQNFSAPALHCIESPAESYLWSTQPGRADSALAYAKRTFWMKEDIEAPVLLSVSDTTMKNLVLTSHVLQFHRRRVGLLYRRVKARTPEPLHVDYLFLVRGWNRPLEEALELFRPDTLVLDATLSDFYRHRYRQEAKDYRIPLHDLQRDGALLVDVLSP
ncbi:MAG: ComEC/Rec2 family competence protein [Alloprevotella sp.]|nr:ComEC/Rec2 family competence protein [Alloprevotella sp.]